MGNSALVLFHGLTAQVSRMFHIRRKREFIVTRKGVF